MAVDNITFVKHRNEMKNPKVQVSFFLHRWDKKSIVISLEEFVADLRGPRWEVLTKAHRDFLLRGMRKEATDVKDNMSGITAAGVCHGGHAAAQVRELSHLLMLDFDHVGERMTEMLTLLRTLPYVVVEFVSISGEGIKVLIRVEVEDAKQYATAYAVVADEVSRMLGMKCDGACSDLGRICSAVWDADAYYNPGAEAFPWRELVAVEATPEPGTPSVAPVQAGGFMATFLQEFGQKNIFAEGVRHDFMLKLGRVARYKGFSPAELELLKPLATARFSESGYSVSEGEKDLMSGYEYISTLSVAAEKRMKAHQVQGSPLAPITAGKRGDEPGDLSEKSNELRAALPSFPEEVYQHLPDLLARGIVAGRTARERDMLLMGMMANLSTCLPSVRFSYDQREYSPHLYFAGVAATATGKGVVALAAYLSQPLHDQYAREAAKERKAYEQRKRAWDQESQLASRQKRSADTTLQPEEEPHAVCLMLPANASKARVYAHLRDNGDLGAVINVSEINTLVAAIGQDYGKQDDVFCAAAHHEDLSSSFKIDGLPVFVRMPRLGMCLTGTYNQFAALIQSQESGLYSRFGLLTAETQLVWRSAEPMAGGVEYRAFFHQLGEEVLEMHHLLLQSPTVVTFTAAQWAEHTSRFTVLLAGVVAEGEDSPGAIILRHGLLVMRLAAVLTALRKGESRWYAKEYICADEDFHTAMAMVEVLIEHSLLICSSLPEVALKSRPLQQFYRLRAVLGRLNATFSYTEFVAESVASDMSVSTAKRLLKRAEKGQFVVYGGNHYEKTEKACGEMGPGVNPEPNEPWG